MKKLLLILVGMMIGFGGYFLYDQRKSIKPISLGFHHVSKQSAEFKKWTVFNPKEEHFAASFPKKPESEERKLPIPGGGAPLDYHEFFCETEGAVRYSVSYTTLPEGWLKYGNSLVLGSALKVIMQEVGKTQLVGKNTTEFKSFPALDYEHYTTLQEGQIECAGTLILVGNILYKVELSYPLELHSQLQDHVAYFIENFNPEKVTTSPTENLETDKTQSPQ